MLNGFSPTISNLSSRPTEPASKYLLNKSPSLDSHGHLVQALINPHLDTVNSPHLSSPLLPLSLVQALSIVMI